MYQLLFTMFRGWNVCEIVQRSLEMEQFGNDLPDYEGFRIVMGVCEFIQLINERP